MSPHWLELQTPQGIESVRTGGVNLFIVSTPLQLLNAIEARDRFHARRQNILAVLRTPLGDLNTTKRYREILRDLTDNHWSQIWFPNLNKTSQLLFPVVSRRFVQQLPPINALYTGSFQTPHCHLINSSRYERLILLDDGCGIHGVLDRYAQERPPRRLRDRIIGKRSETPATPLSVFTCFDVAWPAELITRNDYRMLRQNLARSTPVRSDELVFVAQSVDWLLTTELDPFAVLEQLKEETGIANVRWINHPHDSNPPPFGENLSYPIELFALKEKYLPQAFATYMSSAARTLGLLYGRQCVCLEIDDSLVNLAVSSPLAPIYQEYREAGAIVYPLETNRHWQNDRVA